MLILDTDHVTEFQRGTSPAAFRLYDRLKDSGESYGTTIVSIEEVMRGWMAAIRRSSDPVRQVNSYRQLRQLFRFFATWQVYDWTLAAASKFTDLRASKVRTGTMDLKIACIAIANNATLLSRNLSDYAVIPGLRIEDWMS